VIEIGRSIGVNAKSIVDLSAFFPLSFLQYVLKATQNMVTPFINVIYELDQQINCRA